MQRTILFLNNDRQFRGPRGALRQAPGNLYRVLCWLMYAACILLAYYALRNTPQWSGSRRDGRTFRQHAIDDLDEGTICMDTHIIIIIVTIVLFMSEKELFYFH
jgi:hypothetical protein